MLPIVKHAWVCYNNSSTEEFMFKAIEALNFLKQENLISDWAIGGAFGLMVYEEPTLSYDVDVFAIFTNISSLILDMSPIYNKLREKFDIKIDKEHIIIGGVPIHLLPAVEPLVLDALMQSKDIKFKGQNLKVFPIEYLVAIMVKLGRNKDRERLSIIKKSPKINKTILRNILSKHGLTAKWGKLNENKKSQR